MKKHLLIYSSLSSILLLNLVFYLSLGISISGYWSDRVVYWIWLLSTFVLIYRFWAKKGIKIYASSLGVLVILSLLPFMIPFTVILFTGFCLDRSYSKTLDDRISLQVSTKSFFSGPTVEVIEQVEGFEKLIGTVNGWHMVNEGVHLEEARDVQLRFTNGKPVLLEVQKGNETLKYDIEQY
ncbi:RNA methyltransferase [Rufibacter hautae]|uniref:RNA methyltransferase n=1 Tax=Rufibacter hautae TaxID=2595005 RepID=A0A5B6TRU0_9BACT|nr:RNA methyltransferase [Rufibacter hautae]KAA3439238.1 RNA methyltransferase [Rufibacter hautae]